MKNVVLLAVGVSALGLAGCDQLFKVTSPQRKPGLWEETVQSDRMPTPMVSRWCFDAASDRRTPVLPHGPRRAGACQKFQTSKSGDSSMDSATAPISSEAVSDGRASSSESFSTQASTCET